MDQLLEVGSAVHLLQPELSFSFSASFSLAWPPRPLLRSLRSGQALAARLILGSIAEGHQIRDRGLPLNMIDQV